MHFFMAIFSMAFGMPGMVDASLQPLFSRHQASFCIGIDEKPAITVAAVPRSVPGAFTGRRAGATCGQLFSETSVSRSAHLAGADATIQRSGEKHHAG
jgi:hypothetical protein